MDSSGVHVFVDACRIGDGVEIVCPPGNVRRVMEIAGVCELLNGARRTP